MIALMWVVYAAPITEQLTDPTQGRFPSLASVFGGIFNVILGIGWSLALVFLAVALIQLTMSGGDVKKTTTILAYLKYIGIGILILFFVTTLRVIIPAVLGIPGWNLQDITDFASF